MKKSIFILAFIVLASASSQAQESRFSLAAYITVDEALQSYGENLETNPSGLTLAGLYHIPNSRLSLGADFGVAMYSSQQYTMDLTEMGYSESTAFVEEEDCYLSYSLFARYNLRNFGPVTPYAEIKFGGSSFFSDKQYSKLSGANAPNELEPEFDFHGTSFKTGIGGGVLVNLGWLKSEPRTSRVSLDFGVTANNGSNATYRSLVESKIGPMAYEEGFYNTKTSSIYYRFGAIFRI